MSNGKEGTPVICVGENHTEYGSTHIDELRHEPKGDCHMYDAESSEDCGDGPIVTRTTPIRFWILFVFSAICWLRCVLWNTFGPINESIEAVFPTWNSSTLAMIVNWTTIFFVISVIPICLITQKYGLRKVMILSMAVMSLGAGLRCVTNTLPWFTVLCQLCSVLIGIASPLILSGPPLVASAWFPHSERTTAVAIMMGASQLGQLGSYLEPLLVQEPGHGTSLEDIQRDINDLLYIGAGASGLLFVAVLIYFPSKPRIPPSVSSTTDRLDVWPGILSLIKNKNFLLILFAYGVSVGPPIGWVSVLNYSLAVVGFDQVQAMWVGLASIIASSLFPVVYGRFMDRHRKHLRTNLVVLMLLSGICFFWFLLLSYKTIPVSGWQVYLSVVLGLAFNYTTVPLFCDLAVEMAYPVPEVLVTGFLIGVDNLTGSIFFFAYLIPNAGYLWVTITLVVCSSLTTLPLLASKVDYLKTKLDQPDA